MSLIWGTVYKLCSQGGYLAYKTYYTRRMVSMLLTSIGMLVLLVILFAVIIMVTKLFFRPLLSISIFILQIALGLILLPVFLPILLYLYFSSKDLQLTALKGIIKVRGAPIDGCPGEKLNELFEKPPFSSAKSIGGFSMP